MVRFGEMESQQSIHRRLAVVESLLRAMEAYLTWKFVRNE